MNSMMETEINSQSEILGNLIEKHFKNDKVILDIPKEISKITIIASGSSFNAGVFGKYFFENISNIQTQVEYSCEFEASKLSNFDKSGLYIFISQSGFSKDSLLSLEKLNQLNLKTLVVTNNEQSPMYQKAKYACLVNAGEEKSIAATKTFSASVFMLWLLAIKIAQDKKIDTLDETKNIFSIKKQIEKTLKEVQNLDLGVDLLSKQNSFCLASFNSHYPLCREAALKIQETSYINALPYPIGEFIHGHFAILNKEKTFLTFISKNSEKKEKEYLKKVLETYKTNSIIISDDFEDYNCDVLIKIPFIDNEIITIIDMIVVLQLLALKTAQKLKRNVDKPEGLNKIVK